MNDETIKSIVLVDGDNNEIEFDIMDCFDFEGETYYVLFPIDDDSDDVEFVILRKAGTDGEGETALVGIEDADLLDRVFEQYKKRNDIE